MLFSRLQNKLIAAFLIVSLIPITIVGVYSIYSKSEALSKAAVERLTSEVSDKAKNVHYFLSDAESDILALSSLSSLKNFLDAYAAQDYEAAEYWRRQVEQDFLTFSESEKMYYQIRYIDASGNEVVRIDSDGKVSRIVPRDKLQYKGDRYYFIETMQLSRGEVFVSPVDLNREGSPPTIEIPYKPVIRYATPIYDSFGEKRGIVITNIFAEYFLSPLKKTTEGYEVFLVDQDGYYLAHPNASKEWGSTRDLGTGENLKKDYPHLASQILINPKGIVEDEREILAFSSISTGNNGNRLIIIEKAPKDVIFASITSFKKFFIYFFATSMLLAIALAVYLARRITKPVTELADATKRISNGDFRAKVPVKTKDEVGMLAEHFNAMTMQLKKSYEELKESNEFLDSVFNSITDMIFIRDKNYRIIKANSVAKQISGEGIIGGLCYKRIRGKEKPCGDCPMNYTFETGKAMTQEVYDDKLKEHLLISTYPIMENGEVKAVVEVIKIITEQKKMEQQQRQVEKLATIGRLAASVAHEINTPLTCILMDAQMLLEEIKDENAKQKLEEIVEQAESAAQIVQNLLDFSRQPKPKVTLVDINSEIMKVLELLKASLNNIEVVKELDPCLPKVLGDAKQLRQVFVNIITNAIQAMLNGGRLTISTRQRDGWVEVEIADTGVGIPEEIIDKIFDPFFTTKELGMGTGLGLSIALGIVRSHQGKIEVRSKLGEGSVFTVKLPVGDKNEWENSCGGR